MKTFVTTASFSAFMLALIWGGAVILSSTTYLAEARRRGAEGQLIVGVLRRMVWPLIIAAASAAVFIVTDIAIAD